MFSLYMNKEMPSEIVDETDILVYNYKHNSNYNYKLKNKICHNYCKIHFFIKCEIKEQSIIDKT